MQGPLSPPTHLRTATSFPLGQEPSHSYCQVKSGGTFQAVVDACEQAVIAHTRGTAAACSIPEHKPDGGSRALP